MWSTDRSGLLGHNPHNQSDQRLRYFQTIQDRAKLLQRSQLPAAEGAFDHIILQDGPLFGGAILSPEGR
jgi:hypothetical protein